MNPLANVMGCPVCGVLEVVVWFLVCVVKELRWDLLTVLSSSEFGICKHSFFGFPLRGRRVFGCGRHAWSVGRRRR